MPAPRLEINLDKLYHNAHALVERLRSRHISVTAVTKATLGLPEVANTFLRAGVIGIGDSRIENIRTLHDAGVSAALTLIRTPMLSQVESVVRYADTSFNSEIVVIKRLAHAAQNAQCMHGIVLMVELGDLREGILPADLMQVVGETLCLPNIIFKGIGTNLACRSGVSPDARNMAELSDLADAIEATFDMALDVVSGGNSANLNWALSTASTGRINNLRLGESILLGCEPLHRHPIEGLYTDAIKLVVEVIESKRKPSLPTGQIAQTAFGDNPTGADHGDINQSILAIGQQDIDPDGLTPPAGITVRGASSDHLILESGHDRPRVGEQIPFQLNYSALLRAMTSPFVNKVMKQQRSSPSIRAALSNSHPTLR